MRQNRWKGEDENRDEEKLKDPDPELSFDILKIGNCELPVTLITNLNQEFLHVVTNKFNDIIPGYRFPIFQFLI